jgi:hypothetical protein
VCGCSVVAAAAPRRAALKPARVCSRRAADARSPRAAPQALPHPAGVRGARVGARDGAQGGVTRRERSQAAPRDQAPREGCLLGGAAGAAHRRALRRAHRAGGGGVRLVDGASRRCASVRVRAVASPR